MAGLDNIDPQGELVRRIVALEANVRRIGTLRREPGQGVAVINPFSVALTTGGDSPEWTGASYQTTDTWFPPGYSGGNLVVPMDGLYLCVGVLGQLSVGSPTYCALRVLNSSESGLGDKRPASATTSHRIVTIAEFEAGDETNLLVDTQANATYLGAELKIIRLADLFFQTPDLFPL